MMINNELQNRTALVTGANRGIGKAITEGFLNAGIKKVYTAVRDKSSVKNLINTYGDNIVPIEFELTQKETIEEMAKIAQDVDIVVSNAGVIKLSTPVEGEMFDALKYQMEGNVFSLVHMAQAFGPVLKKNGGGAFVQMNSLASIKNFLPFTGYSASKAASYAITQGLREAWSGQGTQVISVIAGPIKTDMSKSAGMAEGAPEPSLVADGIITALGNGNFFVYPDKIAQSVAETYGPFAKNVLEIEH